MMTPDEVNAVSRWQLSLFEKVVGSVVVALLGWMAWTVQITFTQVAVIEAKLTLATSDNYTGSDAVRDQSIADATTRALEARVTKLESDR